MYTFIKRTAAPPMLASFDAPNRETCTVRRMQTNTPLQALILMNDPQFISAAKALSIRMKTKSSLDEQINYAFERATCRKPSSKEMMILKTLYQKQAQFYKSNPKELKEFGADTAEDAARTMLASSILNLSETITRQ